MLKLIIAGASGMVGKTLLEMALADEEVGRVVSLVRRRTNNKNPKLEEVVVEDFANLEKYQVSFVDIHAAFFCIGVYSGQVPDQKFKEITVDYAVEFARILHEESPSSTLCLLSGSGADRTEKSRLAFARYKGMAENQISEMEGLHFHTFRPAYIYPVEGRKEPGLMYSVSRFMYPMIKLFGKNASIKSTELAEAMLRVGLNGYNQEVLENKDILGVLNQ